MCHCAKRKGYYHDGTKERHFAPLVNVSLEALVPQDHFYRHLEQTLLSIFHSFARHLTT
jgi:hypothetical protein